MLKVIVLGIAFSSVWSGLAQTASTPDASAAARAAFQAGHYDVALTAFKKLIIAEPDNAVYQEFAAEAALNLNDAAFAIQTLEPLEVAHPEAWQAHLLLARAYAQTATQDHRAEERDAEIAWAIQQHKQDPNAPLGRMRDFLLEKVQQGQTIVAFYPALTPWSPYQVHLIARTFDAAGHPGLRVTLESSDADQSLFAKQHSGEAAASQREYSLDGYGPDAKTADGQLVQTHYTYAFLVGEPKYDDLRARVLAIVAGTTHPLSSRTGPVQ